MASVAVTSLMRTLELELLQPQPRPIVQENELISGNKELIEFFREDLEFLMQQFDEKRMDDVETIKHVETKLRDLAFRVEDEIEFQIVDLYAETPQRDTDDDEKTHHCLRFCQNFRRAAEKPQRDTDREKIQPCLRLLHILQKAIEDIDHMNIELAEVKSLYEHVLDLQGTNSAVDVLPTSEEVMMMGETSQHASQLEDIMVGKNNEFKAIMELLIKHSSKQREVVSIKGMGGIGKTTLARRVYEDPSTASHFDKRAWVVSSQHHNKRQMFVGLLKSMGNAETGSDEELALRIYQGLKGQRYLVVIDDIWSREAWDAIKACFPDERNSSRILLTTRLAEVANYTCSNNDFSHQMHLLDQSESWNLFSERTSLKGVEFETIGRPIVEKCNGLPLAIVVAAGLFSKLDTLDEWKKVAKALNSSATTDIAEACSKMFSLSYSHLPRNLKACFLYLGVYPEDEEINANNLARLWAAEGFVKSFKKESFEAVAERNILELVDRNLIIASKQSSNGRKVKTFCMHDLVHAFCVREAKKENLLHVVNENGSGVPQKGFRWLSIQSSNCDVPALYSSSKSCRSIFYFPSSERGKVPSLNLKSFVLLRVLYIANYESSLQGIHSEIVDLVHLRYLYSKMTEQLSNLKPIKAWNLQTLCVGWCTLPYVLEFPQLWYFHSDFFKKLDPPMFVHRNLHTIFELNLSQCSKKLFASIPSLKKVCIIGGIVNLPGILSHLEQLERLKISDAACEFTSYKFGLSSNLKKLTFSVTKCQWKDISILSRLPMLEVLKLEDTACIGKEWELTKEVKFSQLMFLKLDKTCLEDWNASDDNFPKLERLVLHWCYGLKEIPMSFAEISTLESVELFACLPSAVNSAKQIQEEQHDQGNYSMAVIEKYVIKGFK